MTKKGKRGGKPEAATVQFAGETPTAAVSTEETKKAKSKQPKREKPQEGEEKKQSSTHFKPKTSREVRKIQEVEGGYYDDLGFYNLPEGGK